MGSWSCNVCGRTNRIEFVFSGGTHKVKFYEKKSASGANVLCYEVNYNGKQVVKESRAGLQLDNRVCF